MADFYNAWKNHAESINPQGAPGRMAEILGTDPHTGSSFVSTQNEDYGAELLEGRGSTECCCKITGSTGLGDYVYTCCETAPGECALRVGSEPSLACLYCVERADENGNLHRACIREEAKEQAMRKMYEEQTDQKLDSAYHGVAPQPPYDPATFQFS